MSRTYPSGGFQTPDKSGLPSASRGAGADRLILPSGVRGTVERGRFCHCADSVTPIRSAIAHDVSSFFISISVQCMVLSVTKNSRSR